MNWFKYSQKTPSYFDVGHNSIGPVFLWVHDGRWLHINSTEENHDSFEGGYLANGRVQGNKGSFFVDFSKIFRDPQSVVLKIISDLQKDFSKVTFTTFDQGREVELTSWYRQKFASNNRKVKLGQSVEGSAWEWWIRDGTAFSAIGALGDDGHADMVAKYILESKNIHDFYDYVNADYPMSDGSKDMYQALTKKGLTPELISILNNWANGSGEKARAFGLKNLEWKRVVGNNIETYTLTSLDIQSIVEGINYIEENNDKEGRSLWNIDVTSTRKYYHQVPLYILRMGPKALRDFDNTASPHKMSKNMNWYKKTKFASDIEKDLGMKREFAGLIVNVENPAGTDRIGVDPNGHQWRVKMLYDYGFIYSAKGADGEGLDVYLGPDQEAENVYIVHQNSPDDGSYDEDKVMIGFGSGKEAKEAYLEHYDDPKFFGSMTTVSFDDFVDEIENANKKCQVKWKKNKK